MIADAGALEYVLHRRLGETWTLGDTGVRVQVVARAAAGAAPVRAGDGRAPLPGRVPGGRGLSLLPDRDASPAASRRSSKRSSRASRTSASTPRPRRPASRPSTASRTPTSPRSRRSGAWACCSGRSGSGRSWSATPSSSAASWRCCARSATARATCGPWCSRRRRSCCCWASGSAPARRSSPPLPGLAERATLPSLAPVLLLLAAVAAAGLVVSRLAASAVLAPAGARVAALGVGCQGSVRRCDERRARAAAVCSPRASWPRSPRPRRLPATGRSGAARIATGG